MSSTLPDFLRETQSAVKSQMRDGALYEELIFAGIVMDHMSEIGMTFEPVECHYEGTVGNAILRLSGYSISDDTDQLDLFVSLYAGVDEPTPIPDSETKVAAERCLRFLTLCAEGKMAQRLDQSSDVASLANTLQHIYNDLEQVRIYVITDRVAKSKSFKTRDIGGKAVRLEVMDIERLHRHTSEGKPRDELVVDFKEVSGSPLPCVYVPGESDDYDYAMTAVPGEALRLLYEKFGARLLEANVRSFLSVKGKGVNAGIQSTLRAAPERFMAYNNGIVIVADEMVLGKTSEGEQGIAWLKGLQIVNGGQTTASLYFTKKKYPDTDLSRGDWMSVAVGADRDGRKHVLSVREGGAADPAVAEGILEDLVDRGVSPERGLLLVTEGSRALDERLLPFWGPGALVGHCRRRLLQDVLEHLPEEGRPRTRRNLERAWLQDPDDAARSLAQVCDELRRPHPGAAERLERSLEPCMAVARLGIPHPLRDHLEVAGPARMALLEGRRGGVGLEGLARGVLDWQRKTKRLIGHRDLPALVGALAAAQTGGRS